MENLIIVRTLHQLLSLSSYLKDKQYIAYDCETTGLDKEAEIIGFSVCAEVDIAYYVVLSEWDQEQQKLIECETKKGAKSFLEELKDKSLIMHNAVFDCWKAETNFNVNLMPSVHTDTMILAHLLDENRYVGLKELAVSVFGEDSKNEQIEMKKSIQERGGTITRDKYELYKASSELIGKYGAKDTLLTLKLFYHLIPDLYEQELDIFFFEESMPLLKGPTYDLNTTGLRVDLDALKKLKSELEVSCMEAKAFIHQETLKYVKDKYPATKKTNTFNIGASKQLSWLLFIKLGNPFYTLTKGGRKLCQDLGLKMPYSLAAKKEFLQTVTDQKGSIYKEGEYNPKTNKISASKKVMDVWHYLACDKETLKKLAPKYKWVQSLLDYSKDLKLLNTYVQGIEDRLNYGIIRSSFIQHGTTSGRYSSRNPNFQNLPRKDKRIKACIIARPGNIFVGADYSQLEPRVFASFSKDDRLMRCFENGDDFYSVIGVEVFDKKQFSLKKDEENSFASKFPDLRDISKVVGLSATYGTTAFKMAPSIGKSIDEAQQVIETYFDKFPNVEKFMLTCHNTVKSTGRATSLFNRPRRLPEALKIDSIYGKTSHEKLPYAIRNLLNLSVNHTVQSTGASIMNRASISCYNACKLLAKEDNRWNNVKIVMQVHDELILEGPESLVDDMKKLLKDSMENTVKLPGVKLLAEPKADKNLALLK